jgi:hypothetical protein
MALPRPDVVAAKLAHGEAYGPTGLSASLALGLSTQVPRVDSFVISGRRPEGINGIHFESRPTRRGRTEAHLRPIEVALLETLSAWDAVVELNATDARDRIRALVADGTLDASRLAAAASTEPRKVQAKLRELVAV